MTRSYKLMVVILTCVAAAGVLGMTHRPAVEDASAVSSAAPTSAPLPRLLELGSKTCMPCKMMESVLEELRQTYPQQLRVEFVDVADRPEVGHQHKIQMIPTQIFFDASGEEVFRHEGYYPTEEIVAKWTELGVVLSAVGTPSATGGGYIEQIFRFFHRTLAGSAAWALVAAFLWGILSILLSPCHLASIPLIIGFIDKQGSMNTKRAFWISLLFSVGILVTIAIIGAVSAGAGHMLGDVGPVGNYFVAAVFLLVGWYLLDILPAPWKGPGTVGVQRKGMLAAFVLGLVFGIALGPCTFAYMAPILAITAKLGASDIAYGICLLVVYGIGHCGVIVLAGTSTDWVQKYLNWNESSHGAVWMKRICGVLVILGGLYLLAKA